MYSVKEIFYTLQGEGSNAGRPAVFCRFAGCNLWSGIEAGRAEAVCQFCDTDFVGTNGEGGGKFATGHEVAAACAGAALKVGVPEPLAGLLVVLTGGEPMLQVDEPLIAALHARGFTVAVETNGTIEVPAPIDWVCVSPKAGTHLVQTSGDELKLVYPQHGLMPDDIDKSGFRSWFLQPMDGPEREANTAAAIGYCLRHPEWRLSLQTHKILGLK